MPRLKDADGAGSVMGPAPASARINNYAVHPARKTKYNGRWFYSNLEAKVAEAMDRLGIVWEYTPVTFRGSQYQGGQYTPDFRLPNENIYIETVGVIDVRHRSNALAFIQSEGCVDLYVGNDETPPRPTPEHPAFCFVLGNGEIVDAHGADLTLLHCELCHSWSVVRMDGGWCCMHCGAYVGEGGRDGDNWWNNLLEAGAMAYGWR